jgi:hypothetical protein
MWKDVVSSWRRTAQTGVRTEGALSALCQGCSTPGVKRRDFLMTTWREALLHAEVGTWIRNTEAREYCLGIENDGQGAILLTEDGTYTVYNCTNATGDDHAALRELSQDQVDEAIQQLGISDSDWQSGPAV